LNQKENVKKTDDPQFLQPEESHSMIWFLQLASHQHFFTKDLPQKFSPCSLQTPAMIPILLLLLL
jgi:hypothetical protein